MERNLPDALQMIGELFYDWRVQLQEIKSLREANTLLVSEMSEMQNKMNEERADDEHSSDG
jgi:hypothetical protein